MQEAVRKVAAPADGFLPKRLDVEQVVQLAQAARRELGTARHWLERDARLLQNAQLPPSPGRQVPAELSALAVRTLQGYFARGGV